MQPLGELTFLDLGIQPYRQTLDLQMRLWQQRVENACPDTVLLVEHTPTITLGARQSENKLLKSPQTLQADGIDLVQIGRGGGATAHNPGQLVIYPILDLKRRALGINEYIRQLESIGMDLLASLGVASQRRKGFPGLWIGPKKIASIGVQARRWVCFHGIAVNLNNDLRIFDYIVPCGLDGVQMTSAAAQLGRPVDIRQAKQTVAALCRQVWRAPTAIESAAK